MPLKNTVIISDDIFLSDGGGDTTSSSEATTTGWHKTVHIRFINLAALSVAAEVEIQGSPDDSNWYTVTGFRATTPTLKLSGGTASGEIKSYSVLIPAAVQYLRLVWTAGTGGAVIARGEFSEIEALPATINHDTVTVGTTAVQLSDIVVVEAVAVKALSTNTGIVYVGDSGVTTSNGFELTAGESLTVLIDNVDKIYVIASAASQNVRWFAT